MILIEKDWKGDTKMIPSCSIRRVGRRWSISRTGNLVAVKSPSSGHHIADATTSPGHLIAVVTSSLGHLVAVRTTSPGHLVAVSTLLQYTISKYTHKYMHTCIYSTLYNIFGIIYDIYIYMYIYIYIYKSSLYFLFHNQRNSIWFRKSRNRSNQFWPSLLLAQAVARRDNPIRRMMLPPWTGKHGCFDCRTKDVCGIKCWFFRCGTDFNDVFILHPWLFD